MPEDKETTEYIGSKGYVLRQFWLLVSGLTVDSFFLFLLHLSMSLESKNQFKFWTTSLTAKSHYAWFNDMEILL